MKYRATYGSIAFDKQRQYSGADLATVFHNATISWPPGTVPQPIPGARVTTWVEEEVRPKLDPDRETGEVEATPRGTLMMDPLLGRTDE